MLKRIMDIIMSSLALVLLSPVMLVIWLAVRHNLGTPAVFFQERPGRHGKIFTMYKFRSMTDGKDADGALLPDEERLTKFGIWLRSTSLDELPELFNILKGDMSFVGPRPLLVRYLGRYTAKQARRHEVRPGLTGLAQISGRNLLTWEEKFEKDIYYVDHQSLKLDLEIIYKTFFKVVKRDGFSAEALEEFMGIQDKGELYNERNSAQRSQA